MYEHFTEKFPEQSAAISVLARLSTALRSVLADYEEISTWLAVQKPAEPRDPEELDRARTLVRELEDEILNHLEKQDDNDS